MGERQINPERQRGLTLIELLVVIVILALASSVVLLNAPPSRAETRDDAERFAARLTLAFDQAIAAGDTLRLKVDAEGYGFETLKEGEWKAIDGSRALSRTAFSKRTAALVEVTDAANDNATALGDDAGEDEETEKGVNEIALDPLGGQTPFRVKFSSPAGVWTVVVTEAAAVSVSNDA